jgi:hypothetical protein
MVPLPAWTLKACRSRTAPITPWRSLMVSPFGW